MTPQGHYDGPVFHPLTPFARALVNPFYATKEGFFVIFARPVVPISSPLGHDSLFRTCVFLRFRDHSSDLASVTERLSIVHGPLENSSDDRTRPLEGHPQDRPKLSPVRGQLLRLKKPIAMPQPAVETGQGAEEGTKNLHWFSRPAPSPERAVAAASGAIR